MITTTRDLGGELPIIEWVPQVPTGEARELMPIESIEHWGEFTRLIAEADAEEA